jgi:thioredoxin-like negative regulator of GroEL
MALDRIGATVATLDVEAQLQTPARYGIQTLPAVLFFQDGQVVGQLTGVVDRAAMAATLHALTGAARRDHVIPRRRVKAESEAR